MRIPDIITISGLAGRELTRCAMRGLRSSPLYSWRYTGRYTDWNTSPHNNQESKNGSFLCSLEDIRRIDDAITTAFYEGHIELAGRMVSTGGQSPFTIKPPSIDWLIELHSFRWLRHLHATDSALARAHASALITDWIDRYGRRFRGEAWACDVVSARLIAWMAHAEVLYGHAGPELHDKLRRSISTQIRYLKVNVGQALDGYPRLHCHIALTAAALCLDPRDKFVRSANKDLDRELNRQILPDGGHISRNPIKVLQLLTDLVPLLKAFDQRGLTPSSTLVSAIHRLMSMLRFMRHTEGSLAQFNGTGASPKDHIQNILRSHPAFDTTSDSALQTGYERLAHGNTVILMDTGTPYSSATAHKAMAGTLSFELSSGANRFIVNCGMPDAGYQTYLPYARATAAHSTATLADTSSSRFVTDSTFYNLLPSVLLQSPDQVTLARQMTDNFDTVIASHSGYVADYGLTHTRNIALHEDGETVHGIDAFIGNEDAEAVQVTIRFHLPTAIGASVLASKNAILLAASDHESWTFTCVDAAISLEESIQFSGPGKPRRSEQIVIGLEAEPGTEVRWMLEHTKKRRATRQASAKSKTPDLLEKISNTTAQSSASVPEAAQEPTFLFEQ